VLLSDGANNAGRTPEQAAAAARAAHVPVSTIAYGTPAGTVTIGGQTIAVPADYTALRALAQDSGGHPYTAQNLQQLRHAFADLTPTATTSTRRTEITAWFTGLALALVLLAVAAQLAWTPPSSSNHRSGNGANPPPATHRARAGCAQPDVRSRTHADVIKARRCCVDTAARSLRSARPGVARSRLG